MHTNHLSELCKASVVLGPIFAFLFGLSFWSLFLGFTKYDECPLESFLPQGLIAFGILSSICTIVALILVVISFLEVDDSGTHLSYLLCAVVAVAGYGLSATLLGFHIVIMLSTEPPLYQSENPRDTTSFCHESIYNFCYKFAAIVIGIVSIFSICLFRSFCCKIYKFFVKTNHTKYNRR